MVATTDRVTLNTDEQINDEIRRQTESRLAYFSRHPDEVDRRLKELDEEWDIERALEANAAGVGLFGAVMGLIGGRKWFLLTGLVSGFLLQHAVQGWCPPLGIFRRLGVRTAREIEVERVGLKMLRGDFQAISEASKAGNVQLPEVVEAATR